MAGRGPLVGADVGLAGRGGSDDVGVLWSNGVLYVRGVGRFPLSGWTGSLICGRVLLGFVVSGVVLSAGRWVAMSRSLG